MEAQVHKNQVTAADLDIYIASKRDKALFHWLMAVILFSKPVQQELATRAFMVLRKKDLDTPETLHRAGWQHIVDALNEAHYVRYDESTATRLLEASTYLLEQYDGRLRKLITTCETPTQLKRAIQRFKGIGPKGAEIFLSEIKPIYYPY